MQGLLLQVFYQCVFAVAVAFNVVGILTSQRFFQRSVLPGDLTVSPQEIADSQMAFNIDSVRFLENMYLMRPLVTAFAQAATPGYAEFSQVFAAYGFEGVLLFVHCSYVADDGHDGDNGLGFQSPDGGAADVDDSCAVFS